jgi:hypothetical protein
MEEMAAPTTLALLRPLFSLVCKISSWSPIPSHLFSADERHEIDIGLLGGDAKRWQTNIFVPSPKDKKPL